MDNIIRARFCQVCLFWILCTEVVMAATMNSFTFLSFTLCNMHVANRLSDMWLYWKYYYRDTYHEGFKQARILVNRNEVVE